MISAGWWESWRGGPRQLPDLPRGRGRSYWTLAAQVLVVADHVPPALSQSVRVVYLVKSAGVPVDVPVEGLADGDVPRSGVDPVVEPPMPEPEPLELGALDPPTPDDVPVPPDAPVLPDTPVPELPAAPLAPPAPLAPAALEPPALLPPVPVWAAASAGARPMTAIKSAKMTFFMGPPWGLNCSVGWQQYPGPRGERRANEISAKRGYTAAIEKTRRAWASRSAASTASGLSARAKMKPRYCQPSGSGTSSWPTWAVIATSSTPGTVAAASCPCTAASRPARGIGIIMTPAGRRSRTSDAMGQPSAWRRMISSSVMPVPKRSVREQSPPMDRAATSSTHGPSSFTRSSAWTGPSLRPRAAQAAAATASMLRCTSAGSREGVM